MPSATAKVLSWFTRITAGGLNAELADQAPLYALVALLAGIFKASPVQIRALLAAATAGGGAALYSVRSTESFKRLARGAELIKQQDIGIPEEVQMTLLDNVHRLNDWITERSQEVGSGKTWSLGGLGLILTSAENVQWVLGDNFPNYIKGEQFTTMFRDVLGDGIFNTNGDLWKQQRKTGVRIFTKRNFQGVWEA